MKKENLSMTDIREYLAHKPLLFDGGMGTYYKAAPGGYSAYDILDGYVKLAVF